ncbi:MAG: tetracycline resistance MFS efflux pump, partial [Opitutus sp.]
MCVGSLAGVTGPALQSYITKHVPSDEQGAVQGVFAGLMSLANIPGPVLSTWAFGWAVGAGQPVWLSGLPFFLSSSLVFFALVLAVRSFRRHDPGHAAA